jgi:ubiquitin-activating enzyme E1
LNPYVKVSALSGEITDEVLSGFGAVVVTDSTPLSQLERWAAYLRSHDKLLVLAINNGCAASVFTDFGARHIVKDLDGEPVKTNVCEQIVKEVKDGKTEIVVHCAKENHGLSDDDWVRFEEVKGMSELNDFPHVAVQRVFVTLVDAKDPKKKREILQPGLLRLVFPEAVDPSKFSDWVDGGLMTQVKKPLELEFRSLKDSMLNPNWSQFEPLPTTNSMRTMMGGGNQLHFARLALWEFQERHGGQLPRLHSREDADLCVAIAKEINARHKALAEGPEKTPAIFVDEIEEDTVRNFALYSRSELPGYCAFLGGVAAQEVVKKFGTFTPLRQWLHADSFELLDGTNVRVDTAPVGSRYDHQISIFGKAFQEKLGSQSYFMVGCGALGCEYLKGFALMGLSAGPTGLLHVTDMDTIEVSNLNRQFLFRAENVGHLKSVTAAAAAKRMNPDLRVQCHETPVGPSTENIFTDEFWQGLDGVCNALDNIAARRYVDSKCVFFGKSLLESGTLGTKANSEIVIPFKTRSYGDSQDPEEEDSIPMCTLRNFPNLIEHCIEWSRAQFNELLVDPANELNTFLRDRASSLEQIRKDGAPLQKIKQLRALIEASSNPTWERCLVMARDLFAQQYENRIKDLVTAFPQDSFKEDGKGGKQLFWSGGKRFPRIAEFNLAEERHSDYLFHLANLYAYMLGLPDKPRDEVFSLWKSMNYTPEPWKPNAAAMAALNEEVEKAEKEKDKADKSGPAAPSALEQQHQEVEAQLEALRVLDVGKALELRAADFEKDHDENHHIDFLTAASNNRAWNYYIQEASRHKTKMIAGKIVPAVATTTAMITGLVQLELYKLLLGLEKDKFLSSNVNLGLSFYQAFEPENPIEAKTEYDVVMGEEIRPVPTGFTSWHKVEVNVGDITIGDLVQKFPAIHHGVELVSLQKYNQTQAEVDAGKSGFMWQRDAFSATVKEKYENNLKRKVSEVYFNSYAPLPPGRKYLLLEGEAEQNEEPVKIPLIRYTFA